MKRKDSNETGPSTAYTPTSANTTKRRKTKALANKGSNFVKLDFSSSLDLDHWDNVLEDYLGTDPKAVHNSQPFSGDSALDQSRQTFTSKATFPAFITSTAGTSDNPISIESSPEKTTEAVTEVPMCRNPGPPKFYGVRRFIEQVSPATTITDTLDSEEKQLIIFSATKKALTTNSLDSPLGYLTPLEDVLPKPTLVAETTQGSTSTTSSMNENCSQIIFIGRTFSGYSR